MDTNKIVSYFRNKGNIASISCINNIGNEQWIHENYKVLGIGDHALVSEAGPKRFRRMSLDHLHSLYVNRM